METRGRRAPLVRLNLKIPKLKFGVFAGVFTQSRALVGLESAPQLLGERWLLNLKRRRTSVCTERAKLRHSVSSIESSIIFHLTRNGYSLGT